MHDISVSFLIKVFFSDAKSNVHSEKGWGKSAYAVSKVGITALTFIQHRNFLKDSREDIVVNAVSFYIIYLF